MSETITIDAQVRVDDCEPIAKAWIAANEVQAMDLFIESKLIRRLCNSWDEWTDDELEVLAVAMRAEQFRRGDGHEF